MNNLSITIFPRKILVPSQHHCSSTYQHPANNKAVGEDHRLWPQLRYKTLFRIDWCHFIQFTAYNSTYFRVPTPCSRICLWRYFRVYIFSVELVRNADGIQSVEEREEQLYKYTPPVKTGSSQGYFHHYYRPGRVLVPSLPCQIETLIETIAALISLKLHYPLIYYTYTWTWSF